MPGAEWKTVAVKVARVSPAHIWQNGNRWYKGEADEDVILRLPVGSHREALSGPQGSGGATQQTAEVRTARPVHVVRAGDTLSGIAQGWGVSLAALERANPRAGHPPGNFGVIRPGDKIVHP